MTAVPALKRGFEILNLLNQHDSMSLEQIAGATSYPKASILRLLDTMSELGIISKESENKHYRAHSLLMPRQASFEQQLHQCLKQLAEQCDACVEWYTSGNNGMFIEQRFSAPENEVQVHARAGFLRPWYEELEAVSAVALAFTDRLKSKPKNNLMWQYVDGGKHQALTQAKLKELIKHIKNDAFYVDPYYNDNGVKRMAAPVMQGDKLVGIVAIAMSFRPQLNSQLSYFETRLLETVNQLQQ